MQLMCCSDLLQVEDQRPPADWHRYPLSVVAMANRRSDKLFEDTLQEEDLRVSSPVLMLIRLTVGLEQDKEEAHRQSCIPNWAARPSAMCMQVEKTASGECYVVTLAGHVPCSVVCWFSEAHDSEDHDSEDHNHEDHGQ